MTINIKIILLILLSIILGIILAKILRNKKLKIVFNILIYIIYIFIAIVTIQKVLYKDNRFLNCYLYKVSSGSMKNTLQVNDYILIKKVDNYKVGDIITYQVENKTITHRIVKIEGEEITTKGDANFNIDKSIHKDKIIGKTILHGQIFNLFVLYFNYTFIVFAPSYLIAGLLIKDNKIKYKKNNQQT